MSHAVHFRDANGAAQLEDVESLDAAIERVERLRNDEGASEVRVFKEVPIEVRTYYRVAVVEPSAGDAEVAPAPAAAQDATAPLLTEVPAPPAPIEPPSGAMVMSRPPMAAPDEAPAEDAAAEHAGGEHRRQLFSRG